MKWCWKTLILISAVLIISAFASIIHHYQLRNATEAYIAEMNAKGEPMNLSQVLPPSLALDQNSAATIRKAAMLLKADQSLLSSNSYYGMKMVVPGKAMICSQQADVRDDNKTNSWEEVADAVAQNRETFALLQQIVQKPAFDFQIHYEQGLGNLDYAGFYFVGSKQAALRLAVATLVDLHRGDTDSAAKNVRAMLAIVKAMREERLVISELVRIAIAQIALTANWEILQSTNITDAELAALQNDWASLEFLRAEENALNMERASGMITLSKWRDSNSKLSDYLIGNIFGPGAGSEKPTAFDRLRVRFRVLRWQYWWSYPDELRMLKGYQILLDAPRAAQTNVALLPIQKELESKVEQLHIPSDAFEYFSPDPDKRDLHFLLSTSVLSLGKVFSRTIKVEAAKQLAIAAIALKRYHLKHAEYPAALTALVPEFVSEVPHDPIDGKPLRFRHDSDGTFLLYSIGDDGVDDGGDPTPNGKSKSTAWYSGRDWVWPQPATAEEIRKFYANPPK